MHQRPHALPYHFGICTRRVTLGAMIFRRSAGRSIRPLLLAVIVCGSAAAQPTTAAEPGLVDRVRGTVVRGASAAASGIEKGARAAERGVQSGASAAAQGVRRGVVAAASSVERGAQAVARTAGTVAQKASGSASQPAEK